MADLDTQSFTVQAQRATNAYQRVVNGAPSVSESNFGQVLGQALQGVVDAGHTADANTQAALTGHADLTQVATAVAQAELALQTTNAIRDKIVQAYQDVMRMSI
jgi:flagellar hook-basal body complex protein FliE